MGKHLLHPDNPIHGDVAKQKIMGITHLPGICDDCLRQTKKTLSALDPWQDEEEHVAESIRQITRFHFRV
jgi:hypothetical protein